jgi:hypothetical protein
MNIQNIETKKQRRERLSKIRQPIPTWTRPGEVIGGGFIVIERTAETKRLRPAAWPFEVDSYAAALASVDRLKAIHPDREFCIFGDVEKARV